MVVLECGLDTSAAGTIVGADDRGGGRNDAAINGVGLMLEDVAAEGQLLASMIQLFLVAEVAFPKVELVPQVEAAAVFAIDVVDLILEDVAEGQLLVSLIQLVAEVVFPMA